MYKITIINDPACLSDAEQFDVEEGTNLADWLIKQYGEEGFAVPTDMYIGSISDQTKLDWTDFKNVDVEISQPVFILHRPLGIEIGTLIWSVVFAVAVAVLMPVPKLSDIGGGRTARKSPNNALSGQTNIARVLDRVPDIFGEVRSYPDLIAPTDSEYVDHVKLQTEYMCIGRGYYLLENFKFGETLISDIEDSTVTIYEPGSAPAQIPKTRQSNEVANQELVGPNETASVLLAGFDGQQDRAAHLSGPDHAILSRSLAFAEDIWVDFNIGDTVDLVDVFATAISGTTYDLSGEYVVADIDDSVEYALYLADALTVNANWSNFDASSKIIDASSHTPVVTNQTVNDAVGPFVVPGANNYEIRIDIVAPRGLAQGDNLNQYLDIGIEATFEQIDSGGTPTGSNFTLTYTLSDNTRDPRFWTFKVGASEGLIVGTRYQVKVERITDADITSPTRAEEIRWSRLAGIEDIAGADTSGTTRVVITTQASEQVSALQERKFNVDATRKTVYWNGSAVIGDISTGSGLVASRKMADAFLHYLLDPKLGARNITDLDAATLYSIQSSLDSVFSGEKGEFSFTFDNKNTPALEELRQIALAARCFVYREGSLFSITRDQAQVVARGLFNRRNKLPESETKTIRFNRPLDHDGVTIEYNDIYDNNTRTITFPDDLPASDSHYGMAPTVNPLNVDGIGIRQYSQAWDRAQYEFRKLIYSRVSVETSVTAEGMLLPLNAKILHVDGTKLATSDGEIKILDGLNVVTSQRCIFDGGTYSVILRDDEGGVSAPIIVTERVDDLHGFVLSGLPGFDINVRGDNDYQRGTIYSFAEDSNHLADEYLVQRKTPDAYGNVKLELINYTSSIYTEDSITPPARPEL